MSRIYTLYGHDDEYRKKDKSILEKNKKLNYSLRDITYAVRSFKTNFTVNSTKVENLAKKLANDNKSNVKIDELSDKLKEAYEKLLAQNFDDAEILIKQAVEIITEHSICYASSIDDYYLHILDDINSVGVSFTDEQKKEIANRFGSFGSYKKEMQDKIIIDDKCISLSQRWIKLAETYPGIFIDALDVEKPELLEDIIDELKIGVTTSGIFDTDSEKILIKMSIYIGYLSTITPNVNGINKTDDTEKIESLQEKLNLQLQKVKDEYKALYTDAIERAKKEIYRDPALMMEILAKTDLEQIIKFRAKILIYQQQRENTEARVERRDRITNDINDLNKMLLDNSVKNGLVPCKFKAELSNFLKAFNSTETIFTFEQLDRFCSTYYEFSNKEISGFSPEISEDIRTFINIVKGKRFAQFSVEELDLFENILENIVNLIKINSEITINFKSLSIAEICDAEILRLESFISENQKNNIIEPTVTNNTPGHFFEKIGGLLEELYKAIVAGQDKYISDFVEAKEFFDKTYEDGKKLKGKEKFKIVTIRGEKLEFTYEQAMTVLATWHNSKRGSHIDRDGLIFESEITRNSQNIKNGAILYLTFEDLLQVCNKISPDQEKYIDNMVHYISDNIPRFSCREKTLYADFVLAYHCSQVSLELVGYEAYNEESYFPCNTVNYYKFNKFVEQSDVQLKKMSFTRGIGEDVVSPIVLSNFTDIWLRCVERMCAYIAFAVPFENLKKIWSYKSVDNGKTIKDVFTAAFGMESTEYFETLLNGKNNIITDIRIQAAPKILKLYKQHKPLMYKGDEAVRCFETSEKCLMGRNYYHYSASSYSKDSFLALKHDFSSVVDDYERDFKIDELINLDNYWLKKVYINPGSRNHLLIALKVENDIVTDIKVIIEVVSRMENGNFTFPLVGTPEKHYYLTLDKDKYHDVVFDEIQKLKNAVSD